jgi:lipopolysaccharide/colanic/teichoic acid biosynthesis glycosyltransferase
MVLREWGNLPEELQIPEVRKYYDVLSRKKGVLIWKRIFDVAASAVLLVLLSPVMLVIACCIRLDSPGEILYRQERVTVYGKHFRIHKFRTMIAHADRLGAAVTVNKDARITRVGSLLRRVRLDELPQLLDVLSGNMTFVGTRPEIPGYVACYTNEMKATLLLPAGITSEASIRFKDEARLLSETEYADQAYVERVLPEKMKYNLKALEEFGFWKDMGTLLRTVGAVLGRG